MIIVATDGSPAATAAVEWAADDAARKKLPLRVLHVVDRLPYEIPRYPIPGVQESIVQSGERILRDARQAVRARQPDVEVTTELVYGVPAPVLRQEAEHSSELVVGSRGRGGFAGMLLGSVSSHVAGHVHAPVVVVRPAPATAHGEIVVGVGESEECDPALAYAFEEAALRGARLRAVSAWELPVHILGPEVVYDVDEIQHAFRQAAMDKLGDLQERFPDLEVTLDIVRGHPVAALVDASEKADLVVVGSRGRGAIGAAVLGSVSRGVLHHARCPVAVVR
ncbi:universal stress protein [Microtetraspora niveoalba]|uniref:universal stress protein n=1 Tax=Microtetraspora niveoalba TaxID=46175 RepID=UPI00082A5F9F|nr:universal stress protein [Microtetraspora niveoalba]